MESLELNREERESSEVSFGQKIKNGHVACFK